ncbi:hypothetical protein GRF29_106g1557850 [Pseudopithomyces chartarum]|uniref:CFEM domain-containing protein n=1 Tax=Pseudopithomyces chartarum TaxID=1892770 RepID=A0AAN6LVY3_9PLEO|nr:hypothetical protein GRF29_106g1557850 [Pseudopithomyces chartarum]
MKTFVPALFVALAGVASAQLGDLPQCSLQCFLTALAGDGCSQLTDFKCHCEKSDSLLSSVTPCVQDACTADEQAEVIKGVQDTCASAGVTISVPNPAETEAPASSSVAESSAEPTPTETVTEAPASTEAPESTEAPAATETSSYMIPEPSSALSSPSGAPTPSANGTVPSGTPAPSTSLFPGAASRTGAAAGLIGAAAFAVFAL